MRFAVIVGKVCCESSEALQAFGTCQLVGNEVTGSSLR